MLNGGSSGVISGIRAWLWGQHMCSPSEMRPQCRTMAMIGVLSLYIYVFFTPVKVVNRPIKWWLFYFILLWFWSCFHVLIWVDDSFVWLSWHPTPNSSEMNEAWEIYCIWSFGDLQMWLPMHGFSCIWLSVIYDTYDNWINKTPLPLPQTTELVTFQLLLCFQ